MNKNIYMKGFTLAEVLITLSILGVVAAIMIPSTVRRISDKQTVTAVKMAYSIFDNAIQMAVIENGDPYNWAWPNLNGVCADAANYNYFAKTIGKYLNATSMAEDESVYNSRTWQQFARTKDAIFRLKNGIVAAIWLGDGYIRDTNGNGCVNSFIFIDVNGKKGPNKMGYDKFIFSLPGMGYGYPYQIDFAHGHYQRRDAAYCNKNSTTSCNMCSCANWIMRHNNMDYKYRNVSSEW